LGVPSAAACDKPALPACKHHPKINARLAQAGGVLLVGTPGELGVLITRETAKWMKVIRQAGIEPQ
jgi:hypothetical protein